MMKMMKEYQDGDYPGLAMSRSIGDMDAKKVGVIPDPQFVEYTIDNHSKYLLICSDGIWEFMPNEQAMKIANKFYLRNDPKGLCHELSQESIKLWEEKEVVIDDITIVVVFFHHLHHQNNKLFPLLPLIHIFFFFH